MSLRNVSMDLVAQKFIAILTKRNQQLNVAKNGNQITFSTANNSITLSKAPGNLVRSSISINR